MPVIPGPLPPAPSTGWTPNTFCCDVKWQAASDEQRAYATMISAGILYALTGRRFGLQTFTLRPAIAWPLPPIYQTYPVTVFNPWGNDEAQVYSPAFIWNGNWYNVGCAGQSTGCIQGCSVYLRDAPVYSISSVVIAGVTLDPTAYRVDDHQILVRQDGQCWPQCQNYDAAAGAANTWSVTYQQGVPVPPDLLAAQGILACQVLASCAGGTCALPQRMQTLTRQGVSVDFVAINTYLDRGLTNIPEVDAAVVRYNPYRRMQRATVLSMDLPPMRQTTWTA